MRAFFPLLLPLLFTACGSPITDFSEGPPSLDGGNGDDTSVANGDSSIAPDTATPDDTSIALDSAPPIDTGTAVDSAPPPQDTSTCSGGGTSCFGGCVDTQTDPQNCGGCGKTCADFASCCAGKCVDTNVDPANCGGCGLAVCHGEICNFGQPDCSPGFEACGGVTGCLGCRDVLSDPTTCGSCDNKCSNARDCNQGNCNFGCGGLTLCPASSIGGGTCADLQNDLFNCGTCGNKCGPTQVCVQGKCSEYSAPGCDQCPCSRCGADRPSCCEYPADSGSFICVAAKNCPQTVGN